MATKMQPTSNEPAEGFFSGQFIKPGDQVVTFTQAGRGTRISRGTFVGPMKVVKPARYPGGTDREWTYYLVDRADGKRSKLNYNGFVLEGTTLGDLDGCVLS